jgi:hypothetical protein
VPAGPGRHALQWPRLQRIELCGERIQTDVVDVPDIHRRLVGSGRRQCVGAPASAGSGRRQFATSFTPELITTVNNGLTSSTITYSRLADPAVYTKDSTATYPVQDVQFPFYLVSRLDKQNGIGGTYSSTYKYAGLKLDVSGRGLLGFSGGPGYLNRFSASLSGASAGVRLPSGEAAG